MEVGSIDQALQQVGLEKLLKYSYLGLELKDYASINNALIDIDNQSQYTNPVYEFLDVMRQPKNFHATCKWLFNIDLLPFQVMILQELWKRKFPMFIATRGGGKSWLLALYSLLRALFCPGSKVIFVGAAFRQSKILFEYVESFWRDAPILRNIVGTGKNQGPKRDTDRCSFYIGNSVIHALPIGTGEKIRGMRATHIITDEFSSVPLEIFEVVIKGFGAVHINPVDRIKKQASRDLLNKLGMIDRANEIDEEIGFGNQSIISGTAYYSFNHFYDYWRSYKSIIESRGEQSKLEEIFQGPVPDDFDWKQYGIIRLPYEVLPEGLMDKTQISQAKALMHISLARMEYHAIFADDSNGFYKRSVIEQCVTKEPIYKPDSGPVQFRASITGHPKKKYVLGIDPASETDNFSIVILELAPDHRRIVYCWTVSRAKLRERLKKSGQKQEQSFYDYCARKIRDLMKIFPTEHIAIDKQGGGVAIIEALQSVENLKEGEERLWLYTVQGSNDPFWWEEKSKITDNEPGLHIIHECQFANSKFIEQANHGLRKDLEVQDILFPMFDSAELGLSVEQDYLAHREYDTLEDCVLEIEELKNELTQIVHTETTTGRDKWDTPEIKTKEGRKGKLRKDRYSALLIANQIARSIDLQYGNIEYNPVGSFVGKTQSKDNSGPMYRGNNAILSKMGSYAIHGGSAVRR